MFCVINSSRWVVTASVILSVDFFLLFSVLNMCPDHIFTREVFNAFLVCKTNAPQDASKEFSHFSIHKKCRALKYFIRLTLDFIIIIKVVVNSNEILAKLKWSEGAIYPFCCRHHHQHWFHLKFVKYIKFCNKKIFLMCLSSSKNSLMRYL